ncbi:AAA family ATPase [Vallitalea okinawensis]|uniref:AAA family ATPase n=1 Tax=Vallitalea okinawensis TaxID=2078660 RepID=UPI000CFBDC0E|nr:MoxR family ATPase [Vallitalea okinawensis]
MGNIQEKMNRIIDNIETVFIGKREVAEMLGLTLICGGHVLIEDIPGVGKTTAAASLAKSIHGSYKRIQFTPDVMPADITGFSMYNQKINEFVYYEGVVMNNIILADEINRTSPKTQSSLLEAMEESRVTVDGNTYELPKPFMVIATQNPIEFLGTYPLPEAQLDRFFIKTQIGYPSLEMAQQIMRTYEKDNPLEKLRPVVEIEDILKMQRDIKEVYICEELVEYILKLVNETRRHPDIQLGASPRCAIHLMFAAKAWAAYAGRDFVIPDDIQKFVIPVTAHRLVMKQQVAEAKGSEEKVLNDIVKKVGIPVKIYEKK